MKKAKKIILWIVIVYLIISAIYVLFHIDFSRISQTNELRVDGMGYSESNNRFRLFMGIPKTHSTYEGVSPLFLIEAIIKIGLSIVLIKYVRKTD